MYSVVRRTLSCSRREQLRVEGISSLTSYCHSEYGVEHGGITRKCGWSLGVEKPAGSSTARLCSRRFRFTA